jgi:myo-inositol-1(or 4)-monophosphatase
VVACGLPHRGRGGLAEFRTEFVAVQEQVVGLRRFGSAALDLAFVAAGRFDLYWERNLQSWDMAAGILIVREAGGYVSDCDGNDAMLTKGHIVAGNETLQKELLQILKKTSAAG